MTKKETIPLFCKVFDDIITRKSNFTFHDLNSDSLFDEMQTSHSVPRSRKHINEFHFFRNRFSDVLKSSMRHYLFIGKNDISLQQKKIIGFTSHSKIQ